MRPEEPGQDAAAQRRAARRAVIKAHHPDRGGDPARLIELLARLDDLDPGTSTGTTRGRTGPASSRRRRRRQVVRRFRQRLPRRVPGAQRYATY